MSRLIDCAVFSGGRTQLPPERFTFRPAAYAFILHESKLLLLRVAATGKYTLPGGGIEPGEYLAEALRREVREEAGIEIDMIRLAHVYEGFFYYDPGDCAYHSYYFIHTCQPLSLELVEDESVEDGVAVEPRWIDPAGLQAADFQHSGDVIMEMIRQHG